jgi:flagellar basal body-associated protein FliL
VEHERWTSADASAPRAQARPHFEEQTMTNSGNNDSSTPRRGSLGSWIIVIVLIALLLATAVLAYRGWMLGDVDMPASGYIALALGVVFSVVIGVGLMALLFYSSRKGYDRPAELVRDEDVDRGDSRAMPRNEPDA